MNVYTINVKNVLVANFAENKKAAILFPLLLTDTSTYNAIKQFQLDINNVIIDTNDVCACCSLFTLAATGTLLTRVYSEFVSAIEAGIIVNDYFDNCGHIDTNPHFYNFFYGMIVEKKNHEIQIC